MRILHVLPNAGEGGTQRLTGDLVRAHRVAGHEVAVAIADGPLLSLFGEPTFDMPVLDRNVHGIARSVRALWRVIDRWKPDVVHAHTVRAALVTSLTTARGHRTAAIVTAHGMPQAAVAAGARVLRLSGLPVVTCGPGLATAFTQHGLQCSAIPNGVTPAPPPADPIALRQKWDINSASHLVVAVGRLVEQKNHTVAVRALAHLPDVTLVIIGHGPLRDALKTTAARLGVGDRLRLLGFRSDARALMAAADVVVMPSVWEGLPVAGLEAMCGGTPLVAGLSPGLKEWLTDGSDAILVAPNDDTALAGAVRSILDDPKLASRLRAGGIATASRYTHEVMAERYLDAYRSAYDRGGRRHRRAMA